MFLSDPPCIRSGPSVNQSVPSLEIAKLIKIIRLARHAGNVKRPDGKWVDLMSPQALQILLEIALHPGITMKESGAASGVTVGSVSRNLMALGQWHRIHMPGLELVDLIDDPTEGRRKVAFLTNKGRKLVSELISIQTGVRTQVAAPTAKQFLSKG